MMKKTSVFVLVFVLVSIAVSTFAFGYIDPSSMTFMIQIIAGVAATVVAAFALFWKKIKAGINLKKQEKEEAVRLADKSGKANESASFSSDNSNLPMAD